MKNTKVPGTGCVNCKATLKLIEEAARAKGVAIGTTLAIFVAVLDIVFIPVGWDFNLAV